MTQLGRFLVLNTLGQGTTGVVQRAWDTHASRTVALRILRLPGGDGHRPTPSDVGRDLRAATTVIHPNVVRVLSSERIGEDDVLVAECVNGPSLADLLVRDDSLDLPQGIRIWREAALGLDAAHAQGVLHGRLTPANILLDDNGTARVADFGLASVALAGAPAPGAPHDMLLYAAPERLTGEPWDGRADQYALAIIVYRMLADQLPFGQATWDEQRRRVTAGDAPPSIARVRPKVPAVADDVFRHAFARFPEHRYGNCTEMVEALVAALTRPGQPLRRPSDAVAAATAAAPQAQHAGAPAAAVMTSPVPPPPSATDVFARPDPPPVASTFERQAAQEQPRRVPETLFGASLTEPENARPARPRQQLAHVLLAAAIALAAVALAYVYWPRPGALTPAFAAGPILQGHTDAVVGLAFGRAGTLASAGADRTVRVWDAATGQQARELATPEEVTSVAFSGDGGLVASGSSARAVTLWDAETWEKARSITVSAPLSAAVALGADGEVLVAGTRTGAIELYNAGTGKLVRRWTAHGGLVTALALSPDGQRLASGGEGGELKLWDVESAQETATLNGHSGTINALAFSADGGYLVSGSNDRSVRRWNAADGTAAGEMQGHTGAVYAVAIAPDGKTIASGGLDRDVRLWNAADGAALQTLSGHEAPVTSLSFQRDNAQFASASADKTVRLWKK